MKRHLKTLIGIAIGLVILWLLCRGVNWSAFWNAMRSVRPGWFILAWVPLVGSFFLRIPRWAPIVRATAPTATYRGMFSATQMGFLANFVLPARGGEFVRAVALSRLAPVSVSSGIALVALDRVTDLVGLMATMAVALLAFKPVDVLIPAAVFGTRSDLPVPAALLNSGASGMAIFFVAVLAVLGLLYAKQHLVLRVSDAILGALSKKLADRAHRLLVQFAEGLHVFRSGRGMAQSVAFSLVVWGCFALYTAAFLEAFALDWPWYTPFVVLTATAFAMTIPGPPGFIGQFELAIVASAKMVIPDITFDTAFALAVVIHVVNFLAAVGLGVFCLFLEGFNLFDLTQEIPAQEPEVDATQDA